MTTRDLRYQGALQEWRQAVASWNNHGEPQDGPAHERLTRARDAFMDVSRPVDPSTGDE